MIKYPSVKESEELRVKIWKRNVVVAAIMLFVCAAVYLNWSYNQEVEAGAESADGKLLGQAALVGSNTDDPLLQSSANEMLEGQDGTTQQTGYFSTARLNRQQARDAALSLLQDAAAEEGIDQTVKDEANLSIQTMASNTLSEAQIENLVTAKGYEDCICFIDESSASVVVSAIEGGLTETDTARIMEIVKEQTGINAANIKIIEAER